MVRITHDFSNQGIRVQSFEQFKTFEPNSRKTYELQELTTDCANQLRSSGTEYDSATNPNICPLWDSGPVWNRGITFVVNVDSDMSLSKGHLGSRGGGGGGSIPPPHHHNIVSNFGG